MKVHLNNSSKLQYRGAESYTNAACRGVCADSKTRLRLPENGQYRDDGFSFACVQNSDHKLRKSRSARPLHVTDCIKHCFITTGGLLNTGRPALLMAGLRSVSTAASPQIVSRQRRAKYSNDFLSCFLTRTGDLISHL